MNGKHQQRSDSSYFGEQFERMMAFADACGRHVHFSLALAQFVDATRFVVRKATPVRDSLKPRWALPTMFVSKEELCEIQRRGVEGIASITARIVGEQQLPVRDPSVIAKNFELVRFGLRDRGDSISFTSVAVRRSCDKKSRGLDQGHGQQPLDVVDAAEFIRSSNPGMDTSGSLLIQHLMDVGLVAATEWYLEVPPQLDAMTRTEISALGNDYLWRLSAGNYELLRQGLAGSLGNLPPSMFLDRYIHEAISVRASAKDNKLTVLDVGGGRSSRLASWCNQIGVSADSYDPANEGQEVLTNEAPRLGCRRKRYDLLVLCNVLQWVESPVDLLVRARSLMTSKSAMLIALPTPEFYRTGKWIGDPRDGVWAIDRPLMAAGTLDMIAHTAGPFVLYRRSTAQYINMFSASGLVVRRLENLPAGDGTCAQVNADNWMSRHQFVPAFSIFELRCSK